MKRFACLVLTLGSCFAIPSCAVETLKEPATQSCIDSVVADALDGLRDAVLGEDD